MPAHPMKRITIVCEALGREAIVRLLRGVGAHGWTILDVEGYGAKGERTRDMVEFANLQFDVIVPPATAELLLDRLERDFFPTYGIVAYESDIRVRRPEKF